MKGLGRVQVGVLMFFCLVVMETARATVCTQGITSGLQTHDGSITFDFLSRLEGNPGS
mgnify:FL=1